MARSGFGAADLVGGDQPRADRGGVLPRLALQPLERAVLPVAHRDVVGDGEPGDRVGCLRRAARRTRVPITSASSASQSTESESGGSTMSSCAPIERLAELGEQRGVRGELVAHLEDVAPVVQALAEDLAGVRDDGRVVGGRERRGSCRSRLRRRCRAREQLADVARVELDRVSPSTRAARGSVLPVRIVAKRIAPTITVIPPWFDRGVLDVADVWR